ncbi:ATP-binding cassette domain-containing protein [Gordonia desulfuricans]|uniref:ATP-binding cassette domain-containing protein n=1 Tax=Gordonia desulfuricans TaxID=89051 RepID=A0A7K3LVM0_9ACTN|nr:MULTISPECIES: ATP-binding cassette domain-containing protein [Gordonia]EMP11082.1 ABC transporter [Gordonia sp. NB41Y]NDK92323.1 ATP-binding cassette domain-containing protein [Gordonia desulfuricans]WLP92602.1 ATP-binding cassette domain-containing protein [Gordonia sp. NB41Y]
MLPDIAIRAEHLRKTFGDVVAVDDVSLTVPTGTVLGVLGPNGAGKTTTVRMLATLIRPDSGSATVFGRDIVSDATAVRSQISLTGQYASVDEDLTASENLELFARLLGYRGRAAKKRAAELIEQFDLTAAANRPVSGFSGGMRRRVDLAASMIRKPALLFLDEPTTGLDPTTRQEVWTAVRELVAGGSTVLLTTQYLEEADQLSDSLVVIDSGRVVASGDADTLKDRVGQRSLEIALFDAVRLTEATDILRRVLDGPITTTPENGRLLAAISDPTLSARAVVALEEVGIPVAEIAVRRPSLDDVFFAITAGDSPGSTTPAPADSEEDAA